MAFDKKTWINRSVEHPSRRMLTPVSGQTNVYDVTRAEGTVTTQGDPFNADTMNDLEERIDSALGSLGMTLTLEWLNEAKTTPFVAQKIMMDLSKKRGVIIIFRHAFPNSENVPTENDRKSNDWAQDTAMVLKGNLTQVGTVGYRDYNTYRWARCDEDGVYFSEVLYENNGSLFNSTGETPLAIFSF